MMHIYFILVALSLIAFRTEAQDTDPPHLNYVDLAPSTVANGDSVEVIVSLTDASQIDNVTVRIVNPNGGQAFYVSGDLTTWKSLGNDAYSKKGKIPQYALTGKR